MAPKLHADYHDLTALAGEVLTGSQQLGFRAAPPSVVLYHEMAHVYDFDNGTSLDGRYVNPNDPDTNIDPTPFGDYRQGVPNDERQAAGLPVDRDGDGTYEIDPEHPIEYTENGLRDEMGVPPRTTYGEAEPYGFVPNP
ncbi:MAG TPA: type III secretion system effector protein [Micromonosporaceae bacterium]|nr:type III secretion system effector protein [Micromonosporaceae bacterium]